jgi:hypothetical protein
VRKSHRVHFFRINCANLSRNEITPRASDRDPSCRSGDARSYVGRMNFVFAHAIASSFVLKVPSTWS